MGKNNRDHFDLSDSIRPDMKDNTNKKVIGKMKDEFNSLLIKDFIGLNPKVYSINHQTLKDMKEILTDNENKEVIDPIDPKDIIEKNKKTLKGVAKVVVKHDIKHNDYINVKYQRTNKKRCNFN